MVRKSTPLTFAIAAILSLASLNSHAQSVLTHHMREATRTGLARSTGRLPASQVMQLDLVLPLSNPSGLDAFLKELYDPSSPSYRQFLTPAQFTQRFGPTQAQYDEVVAFAQANGLAVVGGSRDGMEVQVKGPVSAVEAAFHITMRTYQHPTENRVFFAPDVEPTTGLSFPLWHISGLDNYSIPHPLLVKREDYAAANGLAAEAVVSHATTGSGPSASFLGSDMRAAYYGGSALTGAGQNLGLLEYEGTDLADLNTYFANVHQTNNVPITLLSTDGSSTSCTAAAGCDDTEQTLDMTQAIGMAPGLASLVVYIGSSDTAMISAMTTHTPLPTTIGCSWGWTPADPNTLDVYFKKMAAQGQNFFAASGDSSTWSSKNEAWPADDAYVVSVGGTDLITASAGGPWLSETAWVDSGGGISPDSIAIPAWQQLAGVVNSANKASATLRNGPDVSANANFTFYTCANQTACLANTYGGTSFAAPMWAGYIALVNQQLVANGKPTIGFINPTIYAQNITSSYATDFHDITSGTSGSYAAVTGYDLVTGWGSPNGAGLVNALVGSTTTTPGFSLSASPGTLSIQLGGSGSSTISSLVSGGFSSAVALTVSGQPSGTTITFSPASITGNGSSTMNIVVGASARLGTYTLSVTGTSGTTVHATTVSLTVTGVPQTITFGAIPTQAVGTPLALTATASSGLAVSYTATPSTVCTVSGSTATFRAGGTCSITASQAGNSTYAAATPVTQSFTVNGLQSFTLSLSSTAVTIPSGGTGATDLVTVVGAGGFTGAVTLSATLPSGFSDAFVPNNPTSTNSTFVIVAASSVTPGQYTIPIKGVSGSLTAAVNLTVNVTGTQTITFATIPTQTVGTPLTLTATASSGLAVSYAASPSTVCTVSGSTATFVGAGTCSITASQVGNTYYSAAKSVTQSFTVQATTPTFTLAPATASFTLARGNGGADTFTVTPVNGFKGTVTLSVTGFPANTSGVFYPASVNLGSTTSTPLVAYVSSSATPGTYPLKITGTSGSITVSTTINLVVQ